MKKILFISFAIFLLSSSLLAKSNPVNNWTLVDRYHEVIIPNHTQQSQRIRITVFHSLIHVLSDESDCNQRNVNGGESIVCNLSPNHQLRFAFEHTFANYYTGQGDGTYQIES